MDEQPVRVSEESTVSIPLKNLISIIAAVAVSTWAYYGIIERLNALETKADVMLEEIEENDNWIDDFQPPQEVQDTVDRVRELEIRLGILEDRLTR